MLFIRLLYSHYCQQQHQHNHHLGPLFKIPEGSSVLKTSGAPSFKSQGHPRISLYSFLQALKIEKLKLETERIQKSRPSWDLSLSARLQFFASSQKDNNVYSGKWWLEVTSQKYENQGQMILLYFAAPY